MGFLEMFSLVFILIAIGTVMALFWRVLNKIFRAIEHHHDDDKHLEDEESSDEEDEETFRGHFGEPSRSRRRKKNVSDTPASPCMLALS